VKIKNPMRECVLNNSGISIEQTVETCQTRQVKKQQLLILGEPCAMKVARMVSEREHLQEKCRTDSGNSPSFNFIKEFMEW